MCSCNRAETCASWARCALLVTAPRIRYLTLFHVTGSGKVVQGGHKINKSGAASATTVVLVCYVTVSMPADKIPRYVAGYLECLLAVCLSSVFIHSIFCLEDTGQELGQTRVLVLLLWLFPSSLVAGMQLKSTTLSNPVRHHPFTPNFPYLKSHSSIFIIFHVLYFQHSVAKFPLQVLCHSCGVMLSFHVSDCKTYRNHINILFLYIFNVKCSPRATSLVCCLHKCIIY